MALVNSFKDSLLNALLRATPFTGPAKVFVSIHSADPGVTGASEIVSVGRKEITFSASTGGIISLSAMVEFTNMPAVTVSHVGIWNAASGGNFVWGGAVSASKSFGAGDSCQIKAAALTAAFTG